MTAADVARALAQHLLLVVAALACGAAVATPTGLLLARSPLRGVGVGLLGALYTVPSLALFAFAVPLLGLGAPTAVAVLSLYAIGILARAVVVGVEEIDPGVVESARALGLSELEIALRVALPLASPAIVAGMRTATIVLIATAAVAAWIDGGGLGALLFAGIRQDDPRRIWTGSGAAAALALLANAAFAALERRARRAVEGV